LQSNRQFNPAAPAPNTVALVTAGSKRVGRAIALRLAEFGYDIALHFNSSSDEAEVAAREIAAVGRKCQLFQRNFSHIDEVLTLIPEIRETMQAPGLLINNASVFERNSLIDARPEDFDVDFNVHVKAPFFLTRDFAQSCENGHVINIVDTGISRCKTDHFTYLLSKKALYDLTMMSAAQLAPRIRVNAIAPGLILPPVGTERQLYERASTDNPLRRTGTPGDVLVALQYLLANEHVTGECLYVDGGDIVDR
jgi:pteridine reductase